MHSSYISSPSDIWNMEAKCQGQKKEPSVMLQAMAKKLVYASVCVCVCETEGSALRLGTVQAGFLVRRLPTKSTK